ncbi:LOW QUALITY PROTEIN: metalloprotease TIKI1-like [Liolophura sinensis]|uniref:LOW QUALITY PROTEIN: metalloprotease TIKI1-like n=1 Tax=Liolophura sinensis TaxID=3198878 RepID=UPI003158D214
MQPTYALHRCKTSVRLLTNLFTATRPTYTLHRRKTSVRLLANFFMATQPTYALNRWKQNRLNSFLWTLKRDPPSYFFGTIHVPYTRVWDFIPHNTKRAFEQSDHVFFELDLTDTYTISALANCQLLPHGENLSTILPKGIYERLKQHLEYVKVAMPSWMTEDQRGRGLYADYLFKAITGNWERKRPVWVMLMVNSLTESDIKSRGIPVLDLYLAQEAERLNKITGAVERVDEQCIPLNELNISQVLFALNQTLWQHEVYRSKKTGLSYTTDDLIYHYNCGDLNSIIFNHDTTQVPNLVNSSLPPTERRTAQTIDEYFRIELLYKRNERMAERVRKLLKSHPNRSFFFAFGAGHFLGNDTVLDKLRRDGYAIQHTLPNETIPISDRHSGRLRKRKRKRPLLPLTAMSADYPMPPLMVQGHIDYLPVLHRKRHRSETRRKHHRKKGRDRHKPRFNDLWVKLESGNDVEESIQVMIVKEEVNTESVPQTKSSTTPVFNYLQRSGETTPSANAGLLAVWTFLLALSMWRV